MIDTEKPFYDEAAQTPTCRTKRDDIINTPVTGSAMFTRPCFPDGLTAGNIPIISASCFLGILLPENFPAEPALISPKSEPGHQSIQVHPDPGSLPRSEEVPSFSRVRGRGTKEVRRKTEDKPKTASQGLEEDQVTVRTNPQDDHHDHHERRRSALVKVRVSG